MSGKDYGTIRIDREEFDKHNQRRQDLGLTWVEYLNGEAPESADGEELAAIREQLEERGGSSLGYDDVVAACRQALREELPGEALQG